jgi:hypothetical protein
MQALRYEDKGGCGMDRREFLKVVGFWVENGGVSMGKYKSI